MQDKPQPHARRGPRQSDVASAAGVSTATVSRVLNGSALVRADLRARVEAAIADLGYLPHEGARSLATCRTRTLGAIVPTLENAIFAAGLNAFEATARDRSYALVISVSNYDPAQEETLIRQMAERAVDGLLLVGNDRDWAAADLQTSAGIRCVCGWVHDAAAAVANVGFDNAAAMAPLIDHLVETGHRRVAILAGIGAGNDRARARVDGALARLARHGLDAVAVGECRYSIAQARAVAATMLSVDAIDAVVCGNDVIAVGALMAARDAGLAVPADLAVTGFDDLPLAAAVTPALTTVHVPAQRMGRAAAEALIDAAEDDRTPTGCALETTLVTRASTGAG